VVRAGISEKIETAKTSLDAVRFYVLQIRRKLHDVQAASGQEKVKSLSGSSYN